MGYKVRLDYFLSETLANLKYNGLMTLASIGTVAVAMLMLGVFLLLRYNMNGMLDEVSAKTRVCVFLKAGSAREDADVLKKLIEGLDGVKSVGYVSVEEARERLKKDMAGQADLGRIVDGTELPASLEIEMNDTALIPGMLKVIDGQPIVDEVSYGEGVVTTLNMIRRVLTIGGLAMVIILCCATAFVVANTIRLTVFARRREIRIMQLVGATDWFIKWPFIMEGVSHGFVGSLLAVSVVAFAYSWLVNNWPLALVFPLAYDEDALMRISGALVSGGMVVGAMGSFFSVKKFLHLA